MRDNNGYVLAIVILGALLAVSEEHAWAGPVSQIVTLAENRTFPVATDPSTCRVFEFDPFPMKKFNHVTFIGKGEGPEPLQFSIIYLFSLEPVKFSVPAPSGTGIGGSCDLRNTDSQFNAVFPLNNMLSCNGPFHQGPAPYVSVALFSCSPVPITVTIKAYLF